MENLPLYISAVFIFTTAVTVGLFFKAAHHSKKSLLVILIWLAVHTILSLKGLYTVTEQVPPRFILLIAPPLLLVTLLFATDRGRQYLDSVDVKFLTLLHIIRVPVELVLFWLFLQKAVPQLMTFEGRNFDIFSGLTAPFIYYFGFVKKQVNQKLILLWNFICLALLINIVGYAILSAPFPFQQLAFNQPNIALLYFPFTWLPACVVPLALFAHLVSIRRLLLETKKTRSKNFKPIGLMQ